MLYGKKAIPLRQKLHSLQADIHMPKCVPDIVS